MFIKAAQFGHTDTCKFLLKKASDINAKDNDSRAPLHWGEE
jgi:ankyrin repeat protein